MRSAQLASGGAAAISRRPISEPPEPRQAILKAPGDLELRTFTPPAPGPGEVLVQVRCALSCGTDLKTWRRGHPMFSLPTPFGHEFSGVVAALGEGVERFRVGDGLMAAPTAPCGRCFFCLHGQENLCADAVGKMLMGAYADFILLPAHIVARNAFRKPPSLSFEEAALLEPVACVIHAHEMAKPQSGESALIVGAGPFGLLHLLVLRAAGVREIVIAGHGDRRLKWAGELGADQVIDATRGDAAAQIARLNGGFGPDLVIEATGNLQGWHDALARVRRGGRVVFFGGCPAATVLNVETRRMHYDNLTLLAPFHYRPCDVKRAFELLGERRLGFERIVNGRRRLAELIDVFAMLDRGEILKCAVIP
ncbi:MAG TPA: alcohol dehydrogenase catalytic domain-containing protein [Candidatus Binataceae bacterium]|nr:alcohol dehydrogenase catalytic domain-containing protein [Candidatus Binataceae bacterium]